MSSPHARLVDAASHACKATNSMAQAVLELAPVVRAYPAMLAALERVEREHTLEQLKPDTPESVILVLDVLADVRSALAIARGGLP